MSAGASPSAGIIGQLREIMIVSELNKSKNGQEFGMKVIRMSMLMFYTPSAG